MPPIDNTKEMGKSIGRADLRVEQRQILAQHGYKGGE